MQMQKGRLASSSNSSHFKREKDGKSRSPPRQRQHRSVGSDSPLPLTDLATNDQQLALLESAKDKLRMATIERKRMSSINYERGRGYFSRVTKAAQNQQTIVQTQQKPFEHEAGGQMTTIANFVDDAHRKAIQDGFKRSQAKTIDNSMAHLQFKNQKNIDLGAAPNPGERRHDEDQELAEFILQEEREQDDLNHIVSDQIPSRQQEDSNALITAQQSKQIQSHLELQSSLRQIKQNLLMKTGDNGQDHREQAKGYYTHKQGTKQPGRAYS